MGIWNKTLGGVVAVATLAAPVQAGCWTEAQYKAAQVRELDTMLMVEALRCRKTLANFVQDYNRFVEVSRPALLKANADLRDHFAAEVGERGALNAYDNYMTTVANRYGAGTEGLACEDVAAIVSAAASAGGVSEELHRVALAADMQPLISGERCAGGAMPAVTIAARR